MSLRSRIFAACVLGFAALAAAAQAYPQRPVRLVVPQTPGGASDALARIVAAKLAEKWGQAVFVENKAGAGGNVGTAEVAKAAPDGHTLLMSYVGTQAINGSLYRNLGYEPFHDFATVATVATVPFALVVNPQFPPRTVQEFLAHAKSHPGSINFGSAGNGSLNHLLGEMVNMSQGTKMVHVPYKGAAGALTDVLGGQIQATFTSLPSVAGHIRENRLRALAVTGARRSASFPAVATFAEAGVAGLELSPWFGLLAPRGTPAEVVRKINRDVAEILRDPDLAGKFAALGAEPYPTSPEEFARVLQDDIRRWAEVVKASGAKLD